MIDVVFLLLIFFVMTFQVVAIEGDLALQTAVAGPQDQPASPPGTTFHIFLNGNQHGDLAEVWFGQQQLKSIDQLNQELRQTLEIESPCIGPLSAVIYVPPTLRYEHTIAALSAVRGYREDGQVVPLIENVRLSQSPEVAN